VTTTAPAVTQPQLPADLDCTDLAGRGVPYSEVVRYWNGSGQPESMDEDGNGSPCEATYTRAEIRAELGDGSTVTTTDTTTTTDSDELGDRATCAQLRARGVDAAGAIAYYLDHGSPARMDADGNGIPCETVYPDIATAWRKRR
jgi:hypothetical protein